jgi:hypothetical protein
MSTTNIASRCFVSLPISYNTDTWHVLHLLDL